MSRNDGFPIADISVGLLRDVKVRRLRRDLSEAEGAITTLLYLSLILSCWEDGQRLYADEANSPYEATPERIAALGKAELLEDGRIPEDVWEQWFRPAWDRREVRRASGRKGGLARNDATSDATSDASSNGQATPQAQPNPSVPYRPSVPSVVPPTPTNGGNGYGTRATGTNPRAVFERAEEARKQEVEERRAAVQEIRLRGYRGELTASQVDAALEDITKQPDDLTRAAP